VSPRLRPILLFLLLLALFPAIATFVQALRTGFAGLAWWQWVLLALLPVLAWLWLRHFSILGCRDACRPPRGQA
jgi:hypothetical protein